MKRHIAGVHEKIRHKCTICDATFTEKCYVKAHIAVVHHGLKPYKCSICDYCGPSKSKISNHIKAVHENLRPFTCSFCEAKFKQKSVMTIHINSVHGGEKNWRQRRKDKTMKIIGL